MENNKEKLLEKIVLELADKKYPVDLDFMKASRQVFSKYKLTPVPNLNSLKYIAD